MDIFSEQGTGYFSFVLNLYAELTGFGILEGTEASRQLRALILILIFVSTQVEATVDRKPEAHLLLLDA